MISLVALDYGGVVGDHHIIDAESRLARLFSIDVIELRDMLTESGHLGDRVRRGDIAPEEFWLSCANECGLDELPAPVTALSRMWAQTYSLNASFLSGLRSVRKKAAVGLVTNIDSGRKSYLVESVCILDMVDYLWASCEVGHTKREPELWARVRLEAKRLGFNRMLYVDDRAEHVQSAHTAGFDGILHRTDVDATLTEIYRWLSEE